MRYFFLTGFRDGLQSDLDFILANNLPVRLQVQLHKIIGVK